MSVILKVSGWTICNMQELFQKHGYVICDRQVGRIMNKTGIFCEIRKVKKIKEQKNTSIKINDIVQETTTIWTMSLKC